MNRSSFLWHLLQLTAIGIICLNSATAQPAQKPSGKAAAKGAQAPKITNGPFLAVSTQIHATVDKSITDPQKIRVLVRDDPTQPWREISVSHAQISPAGTFLGRVSEVFKSGQQVAVRQDVAAGNPTDSQPVTVTENTPGHPGGLFLRTIVGFDQSGASSAQSAQQFFFDLYTSTPLNLRPTGEQRTASAAYDQGNYDLGSRLRIWADLRIESAPQQITTPVSQFALGFAQSVGNLATNQVARSFEFLGGVEVRALQTKDLNLSFSRDSSERVTLSLIAAGGLITPLSANDSANIYTVPQNQANFLQAYPQAAGAKFAVFTVPDRTRFFREAYGGLRFATQTFDRDGFPSRRKLPATFDLTYGFSEAVTGGTIHGGVARIEGFIPVPTSLKPFSSVYFFGAAYFRLVKAKELPTFLLNSAPAGTSFTDPAAVVIVASPTNRDYYRVGVGIDLIKLVSSWKTPGT